jgi:hypothetical protein
MMGNSPLGCAVKAVAQFSSIQFEGVDIVVSMSRVRLCAAKIKSKWLAYATTRPPAMQQRKPVGPRLRDGQMHEN